MTGVFVLSETTIDRMVEEVAKRMNGDEETELKERAMGILQQNAPEELIVRGVVASLKEVRTMG